MIALKHIHMTFAIITIISLLLRSYWLFTHNAMLHTKPAKILPHIIDTFLLISGITLMIMTHQYPITFSWITIKILLILAYIFFGFKLFRSTQKNSQIIFLSLAIVCFGSILYIARLKPLFW